MKVGSYSGGKSQRRIIGPGGIRNMQEKKQEESMMTDIGKSK